MVNCKSTLVIAGWIRWWWWKILMMCQVVQEIHPLYQVLASRINAGGGMALVLLDHLTGGGGGGGATAVGVDGASPLQLEMVELDVQQVLMEVQTAWLVVAVVATLSTGQTGSRWRKQAELRWWWTWIYASRSYYRSR